MKKLITLTGIIFCLLLGNLNAQTQIGQNLLGDHPGDYFSPNDINSDGSKLIVGAPQLGFDGYARVYEFDGADWVQMGTDLLPENTGDEFGWQVAMNDIGDIVAVHANRNDGNGIDAGHARVYQYDGNDWIQMGGDIDGAAEFDSNNMGDIDLNSDGTILAISAPYNDGGGIDAGHVRVFEYDGNDWVQQGNALEGEEFSSTGYRLSLNNDGTRVTVGSRYIDTDNGFQTGKVGVFEYDGNDWVQLGNDILGEADYDRFGIDSVLNGDGNIVAISAPDNDGNGGNNRGSIRVFQFDGNDWVQIGQDIDADQDFSRGFDVSINGDGTVISFGQVNYDVSGGNDRGIVRIYKYSGSEWIQRGIDIEGILNTSHEGWISNLSEDGTILSIGAYGYSGNTGSVRVFDLSDIVTIYALDGATSVSIPSVFCGDSEVMPTVTLTNFGTEEITSASIDWNLDGGSNTTINFNGTLAPNESETFTIGPLTLAVGLYELNASLTSVNGGADDNTNNDNASSSIDIVNYNTSQVHLELVTDDWAEETSWEFRSFDGTVLYSFGPYQAGTDDNTTFNYSFDVADNECYFFEIFDAANDGICCAWGNGSYSLITDDNTVIFEGGEFGLSEVNAIGIDDNLGVNDILSQNIVMYPNPTTSIVNLEGNLNEIQVSIYDMLGRKLFSQKATKQLDVSWLEAGTYIVQFSDGTKTSTSKLIKN